MVTTTNSASRRRAYDGPAILSFGFRPFFLLGAVYAGLAILVWLPVFHGELSLHTAFAPRDWHVHEMLYGYLPAVITGFLFTAIPNWMRSAMKSALSSPDNILRAVGLASAVAGLILIWLVRH